MVGVPGRSKGCNTCIKRKIKCDQQRPTCHNCKRSNRVCGGYTRKQAYIFSHDVRLHEIELQDENGASGTIAYQGRWKVSAPKTSKPSNVSRRDSAAVEGTAATFTWVTEHPGSGSDKKPYREAIPRMSEKAVRVEQVYNVFLQSYLPAEMRCLNPCNGQITGNWLLHMQQSAVDEPALQLALTAYAAVQLGHTHNDTELILQSQTTYVDAVRELRKALQNPKKRLTDETLAATVALSMYSGCAGEQTSGFESDYKAHLNGAIVLMQLRGPDANVNPLAHSLFLALRRSVLMDSITAKEDAFFTQPAWRERPWSFYPKNIVDECLDQLYKIPSMQRRWDSIANMPKGSFFTKRERASLENACRSILADCADISDALQKWHDVFENAISGPLYWPSFSRIVTALEDGVTGKVFPVAFQFCSFSVALVVGMHWMGLASMHIFAMDAINKLIEIGEYEDEYEDASFDQGEGGDKVTSKPSRSHLELQAQKRHKLWMTTVRNMCQMTEYLTRDTMGQLGPMVAYSTLSGCRMWVTHYPGFCDREKEWIEEMLARVRVMSNNRST